MGLCVYIEALLWQVVNMLHSLHRVWRIKPHAHMYVIFEYMCGNAKDLMRVYLYLKHR